jgi:succinate dehydrogenase/fumarate reductase flavoprotein subunit
MPVEQVDTLVIGGGQAGLAMSHRRAELIAVLASTPTGRRSSRFGAKIAPEM